MDNAPENANFTDGSSSSIAYDSLGRKYRDYITSPSGRVLTSTYSYVDHATVANRTSGLVSKIDYNLSTLDDIEYEYDSRGNITKITYGDLICDKYTYDSLNRLIQSDSELYDQTCVYTYDASGNILTKTIYDCDYIDEPLSEKDLVDTITYTYGAVDWKDRLTAYDGNTIHYDQIGNPVSYNGKIFTWVGRRLDTYTSGSTTTSYTYNSDGIRTSKTVGSTKTEYFLNGTQILAQKTGSNVIPFYYDANGTRIAFKYDNEMYYYVYNLQGDVTHILNASGGIVDTYEYDEWGKILNLGSLTAIAQANPFRYRGYYYDTESGLYYLNSRYYNAEWGRFINADGYVSTGQGITGYNMFAYCNNNPVLHMDHTGAESMPATMNVLAAITNLFVSVTTATKKNTNSMTYGNAISHIADFSSATIDAFIEYAKKLYESSTAPSNIGKGTYKQYITAQTASLTNASKNISKVFNTLSYVLVVVSAGEEAYNSYIAGAGIGKIAWDAFVEITTSSAIVYISTEIGGMIGSAIPIPVVGTVVGAVLGFGLGWGLDYLYKEPKKNLKGWVQY